MRLIFLIIVLYFYFYNPVFLLVGIGSFKIILIIMILNFILDPKLILKIRFFKIELIFSIILIFFTILNSVRAGENFLEYPYKNFIWFIETFAAPVVIIHWFKKEFESFEITTLYVIVGFIASLISIFLLFNPTINSYVQNSLISYSGVDFLNYENIRGYGIAEGLLGPYALVQGIMLCIAFYKIKSKSIYFITLLPIIASIALNARTGLLAIPVGMIMLLLMFKFNIKVLSFFLVLFSIIFGIINSDYFIENYTENVKFILAAVDNLNGNLDSGATETLLYDDFFKPASFFELFFGTSQFGPNGINSDNGYFYLLWFGGLTFLLINLSFIFYLFHRLYHADNNKYLPLVMFLLLLLFNAKWNYFFVPSGIFRLIGLYYVFVIHKYYSSKIN
jgi:hypothetical protein